MHGRAEDHHRTRLLRLSRFPLGFTATPPGQARAPPAAAAAFPAPSPPSVPPPSLPQTAKKHYLFNHISFLISFHQEGGKSVVDPADAAKVGRGGGQQGCRSDGRRAPQRGQRNTSQVATSLPLPPHRQAKATGAKFRIVGFEVEPYTVKHKRKDAAKPWADAGNLESCSATRPVTRDDEPQTVDEPGEVVFTYDVNWEKSAVTWADRWDIYLRSSQVWRERVGGEALRLQHRPTFTHPPPSCATRRTTTSTGSPS